MKPAALVTLNMRELDRLKVIQAVVELGLKPGRAAERLGLTVRQVQRLVTRYRESGAAGLASHKRGRPGNRKLDEGLALRALTIIRERYADFGPTLACEKLRECHGLALSKETIRHVMTDAGLWIPRRQRPPKVYQPRARRACLGELIQIDGSDHRWFEDRAPACTLLVYVDDATSRLMLLHFTATESTFSYFEATRAYLERYGKPVALYSDKASVFRSSQYATTGDKGVTHFGRAMYELNIDTFCANSSSAKGRVERAHLTLQDRLVKELRLRGIDTVEAAKRLCALLHGGLQCAFREAAQERLRRASAAAGRRESRFIADVARAAQGDEGADGAVRPRDLSARGHTGEPQADSSVPGGVGVSRRAHRASR